MADHLDIVAESLGAVGVIVMKMRIDDRGYGFVGHDRDRVEQGGAGRGGNVGIDDDHVLVALDDQGVAHRVNGPVADCEPDAVGDELHVMGIGFDDFLGLARRGGQQGANHGQT